MGRLLVFSVEFCITAILFLKIVTFSITSTFFTSLRPYKYRICRQLNSKILTLKILSISGTEKKQKNTCLIILLCSSYSLDTVMIYNDYKLLKL